MSSYLCINVAVKEVHALTNRPLILGLASSAGTGYSYPESVANGWDGACETGTRQSPVDLDSSLEATIHAPIKYRNYFNGQYNLVCFLFDKYRNLGRKLLSYMIL